MVNPKVDKKQQAANEFAKYLSMDMSRFSRYFWKRQIADTLKDMAVKYGELSSPSAECSQEWHEYFVKGLKKFLREIPSSTTDLKIAVLVLDCEEEAAEIRALGNNTQIQSGSPARTDKTPKAPAPHQNSDQNANRKRQAENQAEDKVTAATEAEDEAQECPAKRVKRDLEEAENAKTSSGFTVETEGAMSLAIRISDNDRTSTFNHNGHGPAIVTVNVQKKDITAPASANGNKEAEKEGAA